MKLNEWDNTIDEAMGFVQKLNYQDKAVKKPPVKTQSKSAITQNVNSSKDFDKALKMFMKGAQDMINKDFGKYEHVKASILAIQKGKRYTKIVSTSDGGRGQKSVWAFIDKKEGPTFGDVLKAASWKAPAKHARGNLFDGSWGLKYVGAQGPAYLK